MLELSTRRGIKGMGASERCGCAPGWFGPNGFRSHAAGCIPAAEPVAALKDWFDGNRCFLGGSGGVRVFLVRAGAVLAGRKAPAAQERNAPGISGDFFRTNRDATGAAAPRAAQRFGKSQNTRLEKEKFFMWEKRLTKHKIGRGWHGPAAAMLGIMLFPCLGWARDNVQQTQLPGAQTPENKAKTAADDVSAADTTDAPPVASSAPGGSAPRAT